MQLAEKQGYKPGQLALSWVHHQSDVAGFNLAQILDKVANNEKRMVQNEKFVVKLKQLAEKKGCKPGQLALAWVHHQGDDVFPIPGTKNIKYLEENIAAFQIKLSKQELAELEEAVPHNDVSYKNVLACDLISACTVSYCFEPKAVTHTVIGCMDCFCMPLVSACRLS